MSKMKKRIIIIFSILVVLFFVTGIFIGNYFYNLALNPDSDKSSVFEAPHNEQSLDEKAVEEGTDVELSDDDWFESMDYTERFMQSDDGLILHSYQILNENVTDKWAIVVHGYSGNALEMTGSARAFYEMGFNVLIPDLRGHGDSEGDYIGMGWHDRLDMISWIDELIIDYGEVSIALYGVSMGGATVMMASGEDLPENVKVIVEDCGYSSINAVFSYQLKEIFGLPAFPVLNFSSGVTKIRAGYFFGEGDAAAQVAKSITPILFIHGGNDSFVPTEMVYDVYEAANVDKEILVVEGARHGEASKVGGDLYWNAVENFIGRYID